MFQPVVALAAIVNAAIVDVTSEAPTTVVASTESSSTSTANTRTPTRILLPVVDSTAITETLVFTRAHLTDDAFEDPRIRYKRKRINPKSRPEYCKKVMRAAMFDIHLEASSDRFGKRYEEFLNKSRSNDIPKSSIEQSQLRALIDETRRDLEKCTNEIGCIDIAKVLEVQESLLAPIRTLPTEVMCFILHLVVSSGYHHGVIELTVDAEDGEFECKSEEISLLSKVCSRWREIIHSDPSFWSNIQLSGRVITKFFLPADFRAMSTCLEEVLLRSGTAVPMCLDVCFSSRSWCESDTVGLFPILDALAEQASRWREAKLSFTGTKPHLVHMLEQVRSRTTKFPKLENLRLYATNFDVFDPGFFGTMFSHCPRLHTLELSSFRSTDLFDLRHLTTLTIYTYFGSSFAALLEKCPRLEFFKLDHSVTGSESES
ncbi:hypothetical protein BT96DRAFT_949954, partial [Gymnopus androsaceus JB14]